MTNWCVQLLIIPNCLFTCPPLHLSTSVPLHLSTSPPLSSNILLTATRLPPQSQKQRWLPVVLMIPVRLGLQDLNPIYVRPIQEYFKFPQSLGIVGGKRNHSLWFNACQVLYIYIYIFSSSPPIAIVKRGTSSLATMLLLL